MKPLPIDEEQRWLLEALGTLCAECGHEPLTRGQIPTPSSRYLPDAIEPDLASVHRLCRRLMLYADLGDLTLTLVDRAHAAQGPVSGGRGGLWLADIDGERCSFGLDPTRIEDVDDLLAQASRAVAQAWRALIGRRDEDPYEEARLVDVTALYLGFGVFTLNGAHRGGAAAHAEMIGGWWTAAPSGYLSPQSVAWAFAAQLEIRGASQPEITAIQRTLGEVQRLCFEAAQADLSGQGDRLAAQLELPPRSSWGAPRPLKPYLIPLESKRRVPLPQARPVGEGSEAHTVFRVIHGGMHRALWLRLISMAGLALILATRGGRVGAMIALGLVAVGASLLMGGRRRETCSHCQHTLGPGDISCPRCGGVIRGRIQDRDGQDRLDTLLSGSDRSGGNDKNEKV